MEFGRTPNARFENLPGWLFAPRYVSVPDGEGGALRMHFADEGSPRDAPILCLNRQATWSYLYRKLIPRFVAAGRRVVSAELVGFGRSDKPTRVTDHSDARRIAWLREFLEATALREVTLVCQDWRGLIGLRVLAELPERFARAIASTTGLPDTRDFIARRSRA